VLEALIYAGALDKIGPNRASQIATLKIAMRAAEQYEKNNISGQIDLFSELELVDFDVTISDIE
jgi:DNA polymerase-3 subunit alpha